MASMSVLPRMQMSYSMLCIFFLQMVYVSDLKADNVEKGHQAEAGLIEKANIGSEVRNNAAATA